MTHRLLRLAFFATLTAVTACSFDELGPLDDGDPVEVATSDRGMITWNTLAFDAITWNTLTTSPIAGPMLTSMPLSTATFGPAGTSGKAMKLRQHTIPAPAQDFLEYLVGCALPPAEVVEWQSPISDAAATFHGELGLCPQWAYGEPDQDCRERVSACILARNNGVGRSVRISLRGVGADGTSLPMAHASYATTEAPPSTTELCPADEPGCGFRRAPVGRCIEQEVVRVTVSAPQSLAVGRPAPGPTPTPIKLRACDGDVVCTAASAIASCEHCTTLLLPCGRKETYNVMMGTVSGPMPDVGLVSTAGPLPENEEGVYAVREGAFLGDIFNSDKLGVTTDLKVNGSGVHVTYFVGSQRFADPSHIPPTLAYVAYRDMFACQSDEWTLDSAIARHRVCAGGNSPHCAAVFAGNCSPRPSDAPPAVEPYTKAGRCQVDDGGTAAGDRDYAQCDDVDGVRRGHALTTFLMDPCVLAPGRCAL